MKKKYKRARLTEDFIDAQLLALANERLANFDPSKIISEDELLKELGISREDLEGIEVEIE